MNDSTGNPLGWPRWLWRCLLALAVAVAAANLTGSLTNFARAGGPHFGQGDIGLVLRQPAGLPAGWTEAASVTPGGAADRAGIEPGDRVRFETPLGYATCCPAYEPKDLMVERDGTRSRVEIVPDRRPPPPSWVMLLVGIVGLATTIFALLLLLRRGTNRAAALLGVVLLALASGGPLWPSNDAAALAWWLSTTLKYAMVAGFWPLFALEIAGGPTSQRQRQFVHAIALVALAASVALGIALSLPFHREIFGSVFFGVGFVAVTQGFGYFVIASNYRRNDAPSRNRIKIVVVAFACYFLASQLESALRVLFAQGYTAAQLWWLITGRTVVLLGALGVLVHAVLRRQLFDLNFALNRTLVYAAVSFVLLAAFGLAKWVIEHLIPESWHAGSEYYSVGIALVLFLVLHRVHDWVERNVERFLFSPWHRNEEALRRFVTAAGHFDQIAVLCLTFAAELSRFAKGAGAALYLRNADGSYALGCGTLAEASARYEGDDLALALMRAERRPLKTAEMQSALPGVLALPMLDHGKLAGIALLDRKPDGTDYRPDEIAVLGWAAHQVGLDLQAMRASELEVEIAALREQLARRATRRRVATPAPLTAVSGGARDE